MVSAKHLTKKLARLNENKSEKLLHLVLDLDHTLLHTIPLSRLSQKEKYLIEEADSRLDLWRFDKDKGMYDEFFVKLRPFLREFLQEANKIFTMSVYTMGCSDYAHTVLGLIDPDKVYFGDRVITRDDSPYKKTLNLVNADIRRVVIVDDTREVWPHDRKNLLEIPRYFYFRGDNYYRDSYAEQKIDESRDNGSLANILNFLKILHKRFQEELGFNKDLRLILAAASDFTSPAI